MNRKIGTSEHRVIGTSGDRDIGKSKGLPLMNADKRGFGDKFKSDGRQKVTDDCRHRA